MSRQRSHSPSYRSFPWDEPGFDPQKIVAHLDRMPMGQGEGSYWREEEYLERRHPEYQQHKRYPEETHHRRKQSPYHEPPHFDRRGDWPKRREYRENSGRYEDRRGPPEPQHNRNYTPRERDPEWRQDRLERQSRERFRDRSPIKQEGNQQRGQGTGQQRKRVPIHTGNWIQNHDNPDLNRNREMDGPPPFGYGWEKPHEQRFSADGRRDKFDRNARGLLEFEQNRKHPMKDTPPPRREQYSRERDLSSKPRSSRSVSREDHRGGHFVENRSNDRHHQASRSPISQPKYTDRPTDRGRPANRGHGFNQRAGFNHRGRGRGRGAYNNRPQQQKQNAPNEPQRSQFLQEEFYDEPEPAWEKRKPAQAWGDDRQSVEKRAGDGEVSKFQRKDLEVQQRQREPRGRSEPKPNMMVVTEETLTIKVDMSRPVNKNSAMLYSADRQLSLDLVHVGRQRLDFLPTAENLGTNRENAVLHTGTFAQEIITLTHLVKELYFGGEGITLNERFSAPQKGAYDDEEPHELTLSERFSSSRLNASSSMDSNDPLFTRQGPLQLLGSPMVRDPDDLRHDLEKRRQERLEGVKVTIVGQSQPQLPQLAPPVLNSEQMYSHNDEVLDEAEFPNWSEEPRLRPEGIVQGPRKGGLFRSNGPFHRNNRQMRRPNYRSNNSGGPNW